LFARGDYGQISLLSLPVGLSGRRISPGRIAAEFGVRR